MPHSTGILHLLHALANAQLHLVLQRSVHAPKLGLKPAQPTQSTTVQAFCTVPQKQQSPGNHLPYALADAQLDLVCSAAQCLIQRDDGPTLRFCHAD